MTKLDQNENCQIAIEILKMDFRSK